MPVTGLRGRQILDGDIVRADLNTTTSGSAVTRRIVAGTNITLSSTGVDTGTGDVTINSVIPALTLENLPDAWVKRAVRVATTANITLSGTQTIDGIAVVAGDRVLVKDQSTASQNGIYVVAAGAWSRSTDADASSELGAAMVGVDSGTANGGTTWDTDFKTTDTIGTTAMTWHRVIDTGYGQALTRTNDTNVTLTLGGTPATSLIQPVSLTMGWSGQLAVDRGGTGAATLTGVVIGNGTGAMTAVAGTASQLLRRNAGNTAYEFFTHTFASTTGAAFTGQISSTLAWNATFGNGQILLNGTTGNRIEFNAQGVNAPTFTTRSVGTKLLLYPLVDATNVDYAIGIDSGTMWFSLPQATAHFFKWYGGTTLRMQLNSNGQLQLSAYTTTSSFAGTPAGYLAFDASGNILTTAAPSGSSQWTTTGNHIYYTTGNVLIGTTTSTAASYILEMQGAAPRVTLRATTNSSNTGYRFDTKDSAGVQRVGGIYLVPDTGSLSYIGLAADDTNYQFVARANGYCGIGQTNPQAKLHITPSLGENGLQVDTNNGVEILFGGANNANIYHGGSNQPLYINTNGGALYMGAASGATDIIIGNSVINIFTTSFYKNAALPAQIGGVLTIVDDYNSPIAARLIFGDGTGWSMPISKRNASTTTDLFTFKDSGQLQLNLYTTTSSFAGTAAGYLAFDSSGNVITTAAPSGSSQWTTSGVNIYYTTGGVSIGTTTTSDILHIGRASGNDTFIRFDQLTRTTWRLGQNATTDPFRLINASAGATRWEVLASGQFVFNAYTAYNSFSATDAQGILGFDTSGNIISLYAPIYRHCFVAGAPVTASNVPANVSFFASSNSYVTEMDLTGKKRARLIARVTTAATAGTILRVRYAATFSTTASSYLLMGSTEIEVAISTTGILNSGWINLVAGAKIGVCYIALQTIGGDGATDPVCAQVVFEAEE